MLMQMPDPGDIVIYWPDPQAFSVVQKPWGWTHISVQKPRGARGVVTGQIDTCIAKSGLEKLERRQRWFLQKLFDLPDFVDSLLLNVINGPPTIGSLLHQKKINSYIFFAKSLLCQKFLKLCQIFSSCDQT